MINVENMEAEELIWGADEIAKVIDRTPRQTFHMLEKGQLPARKVGNRWVAGRGRLLRYLVGGDAA